MERWYVLVAILVLLVARTSEAADAMKFLASGFMRVLDECKIELNMDDHIITDFYHYWKLDYSPLHRETGCAIICMSKKLELLDDGGNIRHANAKEFAKKHGADDALAAKMITITLDCESKNNGIADDCARVLEVAKCFRTDLHQLKWDPNLDVIVTDVLTEI